ncbi:hypothetical protein PsorP6_016079 [Peronosclerospora sorghi]|uniref:Uncharacterized protein n=1 Tax=Peronosclerospora sorghi TaxID=230839 RepID=A0ACC0WP57_9STRA|nr:hypothetical protein PsorP6_016079 [Peronosclerospora sorghi]
MHVLIVRSSDAMAPGGPVLCSSRKENVEGNQRISATSNESVPVSGIDMPFEELLARELRKSHDTDSKAATSTRKTIPKKKFLKKGARGWWMRQPGAKQKVVKHTLASSEEHVTKTVPKIQNKEQQRRSQSFAFSPKNHLPTAALPDQVHNGENTPHNLSPPIAFIRRTSCNNLFPDETLQPSVQRDDFSAWNNTSFISSNSTDTLGMKNVRQSYEARQKREANEVAEFEAIERDLAAEKESYLIEKQQNEQPDRKRGQDSPDNQLEDSHWELAYSSFISDLRGQEHLREKEQSSNAQSDRESDLASEFDFHSALPKQVSMSEGIGQLTHQKVHLNHWGRLGNPSSDLSAISFDDSVPWDVCLSHSVLNAADTDSPTFSNDRGQSNSNFTPFQKIKREVCFAEYDDDQLNTFSQNESSIADCISKDDAPVSSLVHHVFGDCEQSEKNNIISSCVGDIGSKNTDCMASSSSSQPPPIGKRSLSTLKQKLGNKQKSSVLRMSKNRSRDNSKGQARVKSAAPSQSSVTLRSRASNSMQALSRNRGAQTTDADTILPAVIEEKLFELEEEVKFYKSETLQLQKTREHYEQEIKKLALERDVFERFQQEQRLIIEKEWERERSKMKREERFHERQWKLRMKGTTSHCDRKDRGEVEMLKAQIVTMQIEEKARANKLKAAANNSRQRVSELEGKNRALSAEIKFLEKERLEHWKKYEQLLKETQDASKLTSECRVPRRDYASENTSLRRFVKKSCPLNSSSRHGVELSSMDGYNSQRSNLDRKDPHSSSAFTAENDLDNVSVKGLVSNADHTCDLESYEWALRATDGDDGDLHNACKPDQKYSDRDREDTMTSTSSEYKELTKRVDHAGGSLEYLYSDGSRKIIFPNGIKKEIDVNGHILIKFTNGDHKEFFPDTGISVYNYLEAQTKLTTYPDHRKVYEFPNQQVETSLPDGTTEIQFADGIKKTIQPNGDEFSVFPDGTTLFEKPYGLREVTLLNQNKIRYFPDGQVVCVTPDGYETSVQSDSELVQLIDNA